jgi:hypothetical protein
MCAKDPHGERAKIAVTVLRRQGSKVLLDVEAGTSRYFPPKIRMSFLEGRYSRSPGMEANEWQIILEQFLAMGVIVKEEVVNVDSD